MAKAGDVAKGFAFENQLILSTLVWASACLPSGKFPSLSSNLFFLLLLVQRTSAGNHHHHIKCTLFHYFSNHQIQSATTVANPKLHTPYFNACLDLEVPSDCYMAFESFFQDITKETCTCTFKWAT